MRRGDDGVSLEVIFPDRWPLQPFRSLFSESDVRNGNDTDREPLSVSEYRGVVPRDVLAGQMASEDVSTYRVVHPGQLAANVMWLDKSGLGVSAHTGYVSPAYKVFDISDSLDRSFANHLLRSTLYRAVFQSLGRGVRPNAQMVDTTELRAMKIPVPPLSEQRVIADFLDRETAKIDALIEKQTKLISRLRERRVEAVASAVTKGIHGSALISVNSDWMDHLPESWSVGRIQYDFEVVLGKMLDAGKEAPVSSTLLPYIRAANIQPWGLLLDDINEMPYTPREASRLDLRLGDLLVVEGGSVGVSHLLREAMPGWSFQKTVNRVRSRSGASTHFLHYVLDFYRNRGVFGIVCSGSTIAHLTSEKLRAMDWPKPPLDEQRQIAVHLDRETAKIDALIAKAERFIELARERRSALITAAVTGQIDVTEGAA